MDGAFNPIRQPPPSRLIGNHVGIYIKKNYNNANKHYNYHNKLIIIIKINDNYIDK